MLYLFIFLIIIVFFIFKFIKISNPYIKTILKFILFSLIISIVLELTIFNFRHYESLFFTNNIELNNISYSKNITCNNNICEYEIDSEQKELPYIEITNLNANIKNLYLDISHKSKSHISYDIAYKDESNKLYLNAGSGIYLKSLNNSKYIRLHPSGNISDLKITFTEPKLEFSLLNIEANVKVPLFINNLRLILVFLISFFIFVINPQNKLQEIKYNNPISKKIIPALIIALFLISFGLTFYNAKTYTVRKESSYSQYKNLAHALANNHFYLDLDVNEKLLALENPYDTNNRDANLERYQEYYWDYAFYHGKYYSYFGIVPCLLLYYPIYKIAHHDMPNNIAICIASLIFIIASFYLVYQITKKYFKNLSLIWYIFLSIFLIFACGLPIFIGYPVFYNLPIILGVSFSCLGLAFYIKATTYPKLNSKYLFLGSLSLALVAGCRPQLIISYLLAIPILWPSIFKNSELFTKKSFKKTLLFILPYLIIALLLMYYNYARFGSPFDFGANYNLTTNDMTRRGFQLDRTFLGIYEFLFAPTRISTTFPFIEKYHFSTNYIGLTIKEKVYGGFLFMNLVAILGLFYYKFKEIKANKELSTICLLSIISTLLIIIADTQMAGILPRYIPDFAYLLIINTIIVILTILNKKNININIQKLIIGLLFISICYNSLTFFLCNNIFQNHPLTYYNLYYMFMFWL